MDPDDKKFGQGPRELTGAVDLISHFKLLPHHEFFCKRSLPLAICDTHYLHDVVGDTDIRKGEGMQLGQLVQNTSFATNSPRIQPFDVNILRDAFQLRESAPVDLPSTEKGVPTISIKSKSESKDKEKKHKKHKDRDKDKDKDREHKKHKHRHKDRSKDRDRDRDRDKDKDKEKKKKKKEKSGYHDSSRVDPSKKHHEKKRKHEAGDEVLLDHRHKKSKHKSTKVDEVGTIRVVG